jgi:ubiquinone/menaquinone biosynthesis C-methylase UbiE
MVAPADVYRDLAPFYDLYGGGFAKDLPVYLRYARRARTPLLEVGAGSGWLTIPLARAGHGVVAVDISHTMLKLLAARLTREPAIVRRRVHPVHADASRLALRAKSDLILVPFYTFNYFVSARTRDAVLRRFRVCTPTST